MEKPYICFESGTVLLAESGKWTRIYVDCTEASVIRAAEDLCRDIKMVTDADCVLTVDAGKAAIEIWMVPDGRWECHSLELADGKLVICGSDPERSLAFMSLVRQSAYRHGIGGQMCRLRIIIRSLSHWISRFYLESHPCGFAEFF